MHDAYFIDNYIKSLYIYRMSYLLDSQKIEKLLNNTSYSSISALAKDLGIHRNTLYLYLSGKQGPFTSVVEEIAAKLRIDPLEIISSTQVNPNQQLTQSDLVQLISKNFADKNDWAFILIGSRAKGTARKYSDWDIGISAGQTKIDSLDYLRAKEKIEQITEDLAVEFDLINLDEAPSWFLSKIDYAPVFLWGNIVAYNYFLGVIDGSRRTQ